MIAFAALLSAGIAGFLRGSWAIPAIIAFVVVAVLGIELIEASEFSAIDVRDSALLLGGIVVSWWLGLELRRRLSTSR